jgi:hypothetical protein
MPSLMNRTAWSVRSADRRAMNAATSRHTFRACASSIQPNTERASVMPEFFVLTNSFAAPMFSDTDSQYVEAADPALALEHVAATYGHPAGLYSAACYANADGYHKGVLPLAQWLCNHEQEKQRRTAGQGSYSYFGHGPGDFEVNGEHGPALPPKAGWHASVYAGVTPRERR